MSHHFLLFYTLLPSSILHQSFCHQLHFYCTFKVTSLPISNFFLQAIFLVAIAVNLVQGPLIAVPDCEKKKYCRMRLILLNSIYFIRNMFIRNSHVSLCIKKETFATRSL